MEKDESYREINRRRRLTKYAYVYVVNDFILTFAGIIVSFLSFESFSLSVTIYYHMPAHLSIGFENFLKIFFASII